MAIVKEEPRIEEAVCIASDVDQLLARYYKILGELEREGSLHYRGRFPIPALPTGVWVVPPDLEAVAPQEVELEGDPGKAERRGG